MSDREVQLVRRLFDAVNDGDLAGVLAVYHPRGELFTLTSSLVRGEGYRGHEGIRDWFSSSAAVWAQVRLEADEIRDLGDAVLVVGRWRSRGRESEAEVESPAAWLVEFEDGRVCRLHAYRDAEEALSARPQPPTS